MFEDVVGNLVAKKNQLLEEVNRINLAVAALHGPSPNQQAPQVANIDKHGHITSVRSLKLSDTKGLHWNQDPEKIRRMIATREANKRKQLTAGGHRRLTHEERSVIARAGAAKRSLNKLERLSGKTSRAA
jgi:hypothetical protein